MSPPEEKCVWVYLLESRRGPYYTGWTVDPVARYRKHLAGKASKYTSSFTPRKLAALWKIPGGGRSEAQQVENFVRRLPREKKELLTASPGSLEDLFQTIRQNESALSILAADPETVEKEAQKG